MNLWTVEAPDWFCRNHALCHRCVNTQEGCQALCEAKSELDCVGIVYSHKPPADYCYMCRDDVLTYDALRQQYGFYRRPGKMGIVFI